ncbi:ATP-dependent zinc metalloprotease FtsH [Candidatus Megaera venefica]|jgi:cell division protease FtsH|uniref:ATP-dependent zinc metalloprotease FtsH n=1 Tax=Candidatus Megaera venefica TaxID=2055910 RepID=A0ABU5NEA0_9RICK|nr:ATP-dependent zinc metalloprotease FtsH [Candidatus Megaera venefica]MEA0971471.1 ATP-dependent zinc metalloprotease FtsH [Candidatus Megaera venefica]
MNNQNKQIFIWIFIFILMIMTFNALQGDGVSGRAESLAFSDFLNKVDERQVNSVKIQGRSLEGVLADGTAFSTYAADYPGLIDKLSINGVHIDVTPPDTKMNSLFSIFVSWFPMLLLIGVWVFFMRQMQGGSKGMGFGKSKAKLISDKGPKITFADVAGIDEAKEELSEIVDFLRNPSKFQKLGGKIPKGCLLIGPPGTGKTLLAKAIAGEANVPFFSISGSDFVEMFVGVGASRVRDMFEQGKRNAPCIIFIDEIDAVGRHRGIGLGGGNDEREQTLNQMLVEMDGFESNEGVVIIAATNRPDVLDPALLRPGRFDRQITVSNPDLNGREQILKVHMKKIKHSDKVDPRVIARGTPGFSGAELQNLVNESALIAARRGKKTVDMHDMEEAKDKVMMGVERRSLIMSDAEKKLTAYHEGGHALVGLHCPASDPIHKATIIPRGRALGMVMRLPESDRLSMALEKMKADIAVAMAGRVAEEIIFGREKVTSGASSDIKMATRMAQAMVTEWGLSEEVGPVFHGRSNEDMYASGGSGDKTRSEKTSEAIDKEIKRIVDEGYNFAKHILTTHIGQLHTLANALIEKETLSGKQIKNLLLGLPLDSENDPEFPAIAGSKKGGGSKEEAAITPKKALLKEPKAKAKKE